MLTIASFLAQNDQLQLAESLYLTVFLAESYRTSHFARAVSLLACAHSSWLSFATQVAPNISQYTTNKIRMIMTPNGDNEWNQRELFVTNKPKTVTRQVREQD